MNWNRWRQPTLTDDYRNFNCTTGSVHEKLGEYNGERERRTAVAECRERTDKQTSVDDDDAAAVNSSRLSAPLNEKLNGARSVWQSHPWRYQKLSSLCPRRIRWWSAGILESLAQAAKEHLTRSAASVRYLIEVFFTHWNTAKAVIVGSTQS